MKLFQRKSESEKFIENEMKKLAKRENRALVFAEYASILASCREAFQRTNDIERINVLNRRRARLNDAGQKTLIHDACVGLLAVEELEYELVSARNALDEKEAEEKLKSLLRKIYRLNSECSVTRKDYKESLGMDFENTGDYAYSERAAMVDDRFVEWIIEGYTMKECLDMCMPNAGRFSAPDMEIDFSGKSSEEIIRDDINFLKSDADQK